MILFMGASSLFAQNNRNAQIQSQELQRQISPQFRADIPTLEGVEDFGEFVFLKKTQPWYIAPYASARGYWTSNSRLGARGERGDTVFIETQGLDCGYRLNPDWQLRAAYNYQLTRYEDDKFLDTNAHDANFQSTWQLPWNCQVTTGIHGLWLNATHGTDEIYRENNPFGILSRSHEFFQDRLSWYYGYQYDRRWTSPLGFDRDEHSVFTGVSWMWTPQLLSTVNLRQNWQFYDFRPPPEPVNGRQEWVSTVSLLTVWQPLPWLQVSAFGVASYDNAVNANSDYKVANTGGEIRFFWRF